MGFDLPGYGVSQPTSGDQGDNKLPQTHKEICTVVQEITILKPLQ